MLKSLIRFAAAGIVFLSWAGALHAQAKDELPFIFVKQAPGDPDKVIEIDPDRKASLRGLERSLFNIKRYYQTRGFRPPALTPYKYRDPETSEIKNFYPLFINPNKRKDAAAAYNRDCEKPSSPKYIDVGTGGLFDSEAQDVQRVMFSKGEPTPFADMALAHELFHATQFAYDKMWENCEIDPWIIEGAAEAISANAVIYGAHDFYDEESSPEWGLHARKYSAPLHVLDTAETTIYIRNSDGKLIKEKEAKKLPKSAFNTKTHPLYRRAYHTGSFWRYLAEHAGAQGKVDVEKTNDHFQENYDYLRKMLEIPMAKRGADSPAATEREYYWINEALKATPRIGAGVDRMYANFITQFAGYVPARLKGFGEGDIKTEDDWLAAIFGECEEAVLSESAPHVVRKISAPKFATRCIKLDLQTDGYANVAAAFGSADKELINRLHMGQGGTRKVSPQASTSQSSADPDLHYAQWNFVVHGEEDAVFLLVNFPSPDRDDFSVPAMSDPLYDGYRQPEPADNGVLYLTLGHWNSSLTPSSLGPPQPPAGGGGNGFLERQNRRPAPMQYAGAAKLIPAAYQAVEPLANADEEAARDINAEEVVLTSYAGNSQSVSLVFDERPCANAFVFIACGPRTRISLTLVPAGGFGSVSETIGQGGFSAQLGAQLTEMAGVFAQNPNYMRNFADKMKATPGSEISIVTPPFDYGFTGSFQNAYIVATSPNGPLESLAPDDIKPGRAKRFPLNGNVVIEEFTPYVLRGRATAALVSKAEMPAGDNPTLPVAHSLEVEFVIAAPHLNDKRSTVYAGRPDGNDAAQDVAAMFPGLGEATRSSGAPSSSPAKGLGGRSASGGAALGGACACSCNADWEPGAQCKTYCEPALAACTATPPERDPADFGPAQTEDEAAAMRKEYRVLLEETGASKVSVDFQMQRYDMMSPEVQELMLNQMRVESEKRQEEAAEESNNDK
ncbi:hypothetical protein [Hyphococcus luteus]|uniref:DUF4157 domain-containing protein n=1 Tax=Hyphococcus luteus TaxID=2058213 RepID=A0A2S7K3F6_9PROT|nr:hypothetical protein [Marinicaulis flavus]PQA87029.1 hypothetical protein CW354_13330 [Marinicaulis flavus]